MSVDHKYFTAEHFAHPDRWSLAGKPMSWISMPPSGADEIAYATPDDRGVYIILADHDLLEYAPPDPWEGVELPELILGGNQFWHWVGNGQPFMETIAKLPPTRFRLVPVEDQ